MANDTQAGSEQAAPKKGRKLVIILSAALLVSGAGGGAGWYFFMKSGDQNAAAQAPAKPKPSVFLALEPFTVNLLEQDGQPQFMQAALTLKLAEQPTADLIKERMPEVRNRILMVLSGKNGADLIPVAGKQKLAGEISGAVKSVIAPHAAKPAARPADAADANAEPAAPPAPPAPKVEVLFTAFIIQ